MTEPETSDRIMAQGQALVLAIEALETIEPTGPIECAIVWFLLEAYRHRLREIMKAAPPWMGEEILSASEQIGERKEAVWLSENGDRRAKGTLRRWEARKTWQADGKCEGISPRGGVQ